MPAFGQLTRTLLLSPPSLSSHPERIDTAMNAYGCHGAELQMIDRLARGLVSLPESAYDTIFLLAGADDAFSEATQLLDRGTLLVVHQALKPGAKLQFQKGKSTQEPTPDFRSGAILAGFVFGDSGEFIKPDSMTQKAVPLKFRAKTIKSTEIHFPVDGINRVTPRNMKDVSTDISIDINGHDDELIDEDTLLDNDDMERPIIQPPQCRPKDGKRRRACKDCTCGLAQKLEVEDRDKRAGADRGLSAVKLGTSDLAEVDFTTKGKIGSCGNCALGDAFRCDGCPYIGLPAFKPGEEVRLMNEVQL